MGSGPCKDCERKGCGAYHSQCERYIEWRKKEDAIKEQRYKEQGNYIKSSNYCLGDSRLSFKHFGSKRTDR